MSAPNEHDDRTVARRPTDAEFQRLLMEHLEPVLAAIARRVPADLRSIVAADDVCQDAYIAAIRARSSFRPEGPDAFRRWLSVIALRKLRDAIRAQRAAKRGGAVRAGAAAATGESSVVALLDLVAIHERTPSRSAARRELVSAVQKAVAELKPEHRDVIRYRYMQGLSVAETAAQMDRSPGAIMKLAERALAALADGMGDLGRYQSTGGV